MKFTQIYSEGPKNHKPTLVQIMARAEQAFWFIDRLVYWHIYESVSLYELNSYKRWFAYGRLTEGKRNKKAELPYI